MKQLTILIWKNYRELRWFVVGGLLAILFPALLEGGVSHVVYGRRFDLEAIEGLVVVFGGLLALLMAIRLTCRDLDSHLYSFWRSRPIPLTTALLVKYLSGGLSVLMITIPPMALHLWLLTRTGYLSEHPWFFVQSFPANFIWVHTWVLLAFYSTSFALGCLIRETVSASLVALASGLLIYFAPLVLPGLGVMETFYWMNAEPLMLDFQDTPVRLTGYLAFYFRPWTLLVNPDFSAYVLGWLGVSIVSFVGAVTAVRRGLVWKLNQRSISWSLGIVILLLVWGASRQLGSNLAVTSVERMPLLAIDSPGGATEELLVREPPNASACRIDGLVSNSRHTLATYRAVGWTGLMKLELADATATEAPQRPLVRGYRVLVTLPYQLSDQSHKLFLGKTRHPLYLPPQHPDCALMVTERFREEDETDEAGRAVIRFRREELDILLVSLDPPEGACVSSKLSTPERPTAILDRVSLKELVQIDPDTADQGIYSMSNNYAYPSPVVLYAHKDRVYLHVPSDSNRMLAFDVSQPNAIVFSGTAEYCKGIGELQPVSSAPDQSNPVDGGYLAGPRFELFVGALAGLEPRQCLELSLAIRNSSFNGGAAMQGDLLVTGNRQWRQGIGLRTWRLLGFRETSVPPFVDGQPSIAYYAEFELLDELRLSPLLRLMGGGLDEVVMQDGLLWQMTGDRVTVCNVADPRRLRRLGYYTVPREYFREIMPLAGGRLLIAANQLHFLEKP